MPALTQQAKDYCQAVFEKMDREELVCELEAIGIACYDHETVEDDLAPSAVTGVEAGDIDFDWSIGVAKALGHYCFGLWLSIEDTWEE